MTGSPRIGAGLESRVKTLLEGPGDRLGAHLGIRYRELDRDLVVASLEVLPHLHQPFGLLHGGASLVLAESLASIGGWLNVDERTSTVVGLEINGNHVRAVKDGTIVGRALPLHRGRTTQIWEVKIEREGDGKLVCVSRCTLAVVAI